jgi:hypothetical protein
LHQQIDRAHRGRHVKQLADDVGVRKRQREIDGAQVESRRKRFLPFRLRSVGHARLCGHEGQEVADVNHALGIVERLVVDHKARMRRALV